jgi:DNA-binding LacI/PurR family transcriptional regulator
MGSKMSNSGAILLKGEKNSLMTKRFTLPGNVILMVNDLKEKIHSGQLIQGTRISSIRALMQEYDVSLGSAKRGIDLLCKQHMLVTKPGTGTFVNSVPSYSLKNSESTIMVFLEWSVDRNGIFPAVFDGVREQSMQEKTSLLFSYLGADRFCRKEVEKLAGNADGVILLSEYDRAGNEFSLSIPAVGVCFHNNMNSRISVIDLDPFEAAERAVKYFRERKASKVKVVSVDFPAQRLRGECFIQAWEHEGGKAELDIHSIDDWRKRPFECDSACLFTSSWLADNCLKKAKSTPEAILSIDGRNLLVPQTFQLDSITPDWHEVGRRSFDECLSRVRSPGRSPARIYLPCRLHKVNS